MKPYLGFALAAYITAYGLVGPNPEQPNEPGRLRKVSSWVGRAIAPIRIAARKAYNGPQHLRIKFLYWRIAVFGVMERQALRKSRWGTLGFAGVVVFDQILGVTQLGQLATAASALSAAGGGTIYISGPGTYHATATIAPAAVSTTGDGTGTLTNVDFYFSTGAQVVIDNGVAFTTSFGPDSYTKLFDWSNCTQCNVYNLYCVDNDTTSATKNKVVCHLYGGNTTHMRFYDCYAKGFTRQMFFVTAYSSGVTGISTQDGPVDDLIFVRPVCVNCGNTATPDGGFLKIGNNSGTTLTTYSAVTNIGALEPDVTGLNFAGVDINLSNQSTIAVGTNTTPYVNRNYWLVGGTIVYAAGITTNQFGFWVENMVNWSSYQTPVRGVTLKDTTIDMNGSASSVSAAGGVVIQNTASKVLIDNVNVKNWPNYAGFVLTGRTATKPAMAGADYKFRNIAAEACKIGFRLDPGAGTDNNVIEDVLVDGFSVDDAGSGKAVSAVLINTTAARSARNVTFRNVDVSKMAVNTNHRPVDIQGFLDDFEAGINFVNCPGITPFGSPASVALGIGLTTTAANVLDILVDGGVAFPAIAGTVYTVGAKSGVKVSTSATGTVRTGLAIKDARGFPLVSQRTCSSAYGTSATPTAGNNYVVTGEDMTVTTTGGTLSVEIKDFAGNDLFNAGTTSLTNAFVPWGSTIFVTTSTGVTWTVTGAVNGALATPFLDDMSGVAIAATLVPYGGTIADPAGTHATWTVTLVKAPFSAVNTTGTPFGTRNAMGITSSGVAAYAFTSATTYRAGMALRVFLAAGSGTLTHLKVIDQYGNTMSDVTADTSGAVIDVPAGACFQPTFSVAPTFTLGGM